MKQFTKWIKPLFLSALIILLFLRPEIAQNGASGGLMLCGRIIIPSLFPFMTTILLLMKLLPMRLPQRAERLTYRIFGICGLQASVLLLSLIGGYPIGAKLISELNERKVICESESKRMIYYCVNAGPGFIVSAVGVGLLHSKVLGFAILFSVTIADFIMLLSLRRKSGNMTHEISYTTVRFSDAFSSAVRNAAESTLNICAFVIIFSTFNSIVMPLATKILLLKSILPLFEVTSGVAITNNVFLITFYIAFGGLSVWCQVFSMLGNLHVSILKFAISRILHGLLSVLILRAVFAIFPPSVSTLSNHVKFSGQAYYSTGALVITLFIMLILWLISASGEKNGGNLKTDMLQ